jgi:hypothetical protein
MKTTTTIAATTCLSTGRFSSAIGSAFRPASFRNPHSAFRILSVLCLLSSVLCVCALRAQTPLLPVIIPYYDAKAYAWVWDSPTQSWQHIHRNEARVLHAKKESGKQHIGTLVIDGCYKVPAVSGQNILLLFRKETNFKTYPGLPAGESGFEVVKLDVRNGYKKNQLIRTAQLHRLGESAATFGEKREPITVQKIMRQDGVFHIVQVTRPLPPGRYALYLPDRAFEFETK